MVEKEKQTKKAKSENKTKKSDFVEIEFVGLANGEVFDTNLKKEAEKIDLKIEEKPLIVCIGEAMVVKGFDKELEEKELGKKYKIKLSPENAFGKRNPSLIKIIPLSVFKQKNIQPASGLMLNLDGMITKVLSVSGGRVITDFNNPLAGKDIEYKFIIKRKVTEEKEKINALQDFFFKKRFEFKIDKKIIFKKEAEPFMKMFGEKFKEILGKEIELEKEEKKEEKNQEKKDGSGKHNTQK